MGFVNFTAAVDLSGRLSTSPNVWTPDAVLKKPIVFQSLKSGLDGDQYQNYNFNTDEFTLLGRQASTIPVEQVPGPNPNPGTSTAPIPDASGKPKKPYNSATTSSALYSTSLLIIIAYLLV